MAAKTTRPKRLVIIYDDGYIEIAKYNPEKKSFTQFEIPNEDENKIIRNIFLKKEDKTFQKIPKEIDEYLDINNFSFIVKSHRRKLPFLKYTDNDSVDNVDITLPDLLFFIKENQIYPYVIHRGKIYYNPLPNITNDNLCMGSADYSYRKEFNLKEKIEKIKYSFFESVFSHDIDFDILQSWFNGKPNIKLLTKKTNKLW